MRGTCEGRSSQSRDRLGTFHARVALGFVVATCLAYLPAFSGGFIWDDPDYVLNNGNLRDFDGLVRIWLEPRSSPQYYPVVFTSFWIEWQAWQDWSAGYHATNILLHALAGWLLWRVLARLQVPSALLAAALWTLHPVQVESVAWVTERKNTLSAVFYFATWLALLGRAARAELASQAATGSAPKPALEPASDPVPKPALDPARDSSSGSAPNRAFDPARHPVLHPASDPASAGVGDRRWWLALLLFSLALLSKSVTATLPAAVLLLRWWKGHAGFKGAVLRLAPFFVLAIAAGLHTSQLEREHVGAAGHEWSHADSTIGELAARTVIAGRAGWFYLGKLLWPSNLAFMYERWTVDVSTWRPWLYPAALIVVVALLWTFRRYLGRGPLTAALFFVGTLFPALGFFNVYPHRYSFVADHFQYLASIGVLALVASGITLAMPVVPRLAVSMVLLVTLGVMTHRQAREYESALSLWEATTRRSERSWVAWSNLGKLYADVRRDADAIAAHERAWSLEQRVPDTWYNLAMVRARQGRYDDARAMLLRALELTGPSSALRLDCLIKLSMLAEQQGRMDEARDWLRRALDAAPNYPPTLRWAEELLRR